MLDQEAAFAQIQEAKTMVEEDLQRRLEEMEGEREQLQKVAASAATLEQQLDQASTRHGLPRTPGATRTVLPRTPGVTCAVIPRTSGATRAVLPWTAGATRSVLPRTPGAAHTGLNCMCLCQAVHQIGVNVNPQTWLLSQTRLRAPSAGVPRQNFMCRRRPPRIHPNYLELEQGESGISWSGAVFSFKTIHTESSSCFSR